MYVPNYSVRLNYVFKYCSYHEKKSKYKKKNKLTYT